MLCVNKGEIVAGLVEVVLCTDPRERVVAGDAERIGDRAETGVGRVGVERIEQALRRQQCRALGDQRIELRLLRRGAQRRRDGAQRVDPGGDGVATPVLTAVWVPVSTAELMHVGEVGDSAVGSADDASRQLAYFR